MPHQGSCDSRLGSISQPRGIQWDARILLVIVPHSSGKAWAHERRLALQFGKSSSAKASQNILKHPEASNHIKGLAVCTKYSPSCDPCKPKALHGGFGHRTKREVVDSKAARFPCGPGSCPICSLPATRVRAPDFQVLFTWRWACI